MASQRFFIIDNPRAESDGIIQTTGKENVGFAYNSDAPTGNFINCYLKDAWIISTEEYEEFKKLKKK